MVSLAQMTVPGIAVIASADYSRARYRYRLQRLEREKRENDVRLTQAEAVTVADVSARTNPKKAAIQARWRAPVPRELKGQRKYRERWEKQIAPFTKHLINFHEFKQTKGNFHPL